MRGGDGPPAGRHRRSASPRPALSRALPDPFRDRGTRCASRGPASDRRQGRVAGPSGRRGLLAVVLAVVLAGCGGFVAEETTTLTPVPVGGEDAEQSTVAPGIPETGRVDADRLLAAHETQRRGVPVRIVDVMTVKGPDQQFLIRRTVEIPDRDRYNASYVYSRGFNREPLFVSERRNATGRTVATTLPNGTRRVNTTLPPVLRDRLPPSNLIEDVLEAGGFVYADGAGRYIRLESRALSALGPVVPRAIEQPRDATAMLKVTPEGFVTLLELNFAAVHDGGEVRVTILRDVQRRRPGTGDANSTVTTADG